jgi:autotransporter translocation and assembly factor TamB
MPEIVQMYDINTEKPTQAELTTVQGEIHNGEKASALDSSLAATKKIFDIYISSSLDRKSGSAKLSYAEASALRFDLAKELKMKQIGAEIIKEIKAEPYYDTGQKVVIPMDIGDAEFKVIIFFDQSNRKFKFGLEAMNGLAQKLESN